MGSVLYGVLAEHSLPFRMLVLGFGAFILAIVALVLVGDLRLRRARSLPAGSPGADPPDIDPDGRPVGAEWALFVAFNGLSVVLLTAGVLDLSRGGSSDLLVTGACFVMVSLGPSANVVGRWWRSRSAGQGRA